MAFRPGFRRVWLRAGMVEETRASVPPGSDVVKMGLMRAPWLVRDADAAGGNITHGQSGWETITDRGQRWRDYAALPCGGYPGPSPDLLG
jgi:hypothetical protein